MKMNQNNRHILVTEVDQLLSSMQIDSLIVGCSGGADSMALLSILNQLHKRIFVVHCNFHLRDEESNRDAQFVTTYCCKNNIPYIVVDFNTLNYCKIHKISIEMGCRELRYAKFHEVLKEKGYQRIAVAHNADDQAETLLLNLFRGSGVRGLGGMRIDSNNIIRPLLSITRERIIDYLNTEHIDYIIDSTNLESEYKRNFIRNEIIPIIKLKWPAITSRLCKTADVMQQEYDLSEQLYLEKLNHKAHELNFSQLESVSNPLWLISRFGRAYGASESQIYEMNQWYQDANRISGKHWEVNEGYIFAERTFFRYQSVNDIKEIEISSEEVNLNSGEKIDPNLIDANTLLTTLSPDELIFRHPQAGDRIHPYGMTGGQSVSKIMKDAKLSNIEKRNTILAVKKDTGDIIWIAGLKRSRKYLIQSESTIAYRYNVK